ncbi:MFS transporter [Flammeovirga agarivorans]|nr:MFS transporter [Flammeovirga agarivorans]
MKLKYFLIIMTFIAVVSDTMLHPFYPQFFMDKFLVERPEHVGYYLAACCLIIMLAFPFWAWVNKKYHLFDILIITQLVAAALCITIFWVSNIFLFWTIALTMIFFKGSYLLMYPFIMKIDEQENHTSSISILSVIVHLGAILGAFFGGGMLDYVDASYVFFIMAAGDLIQFGVCLYLKKIHDTSTETSATKEDEKEEESASTWAPHVLKIGGITMVLYFSTFLIRPFFVEYWEAVTQTNSNLMGGMMYSIPAFVGIMALIYNHYVAKKQSPVKVILPSLVLGFCGILLQGSGFSFSIIIGRLMYGWAVFQLYVQFDVIAFQKSKPENYASDYSKIHLLQNMGVLMASLVSGYSVELFSLTMPFWISSVGFIVAGSLFVFFFRTELFKKVKTKTLKSLSV